MATDDKTIIHGDDSPSGSVLNSIPFEDIIGGPLVACVDAQAEASRATMEYIKEFTMVDSDVDIYAKEPIMISFSFEVDGIKNLITLPLMTIVPIPYMRIDNVNLSFAASVTTLTNDNFEAKYSSTIHKAEESSSDSISTERCIHIAIKAGTMNMPSGMARLLDYFNNNLIQHKTLSLDDIEQLKAENQEKIRKREENSGLLSSEEIAKVKTTAKKDINDCSTNAIDAINQLQNLAKEKQKKAISEIETIKANSSNRIETTTSPSYITNISKEAVSKIGKVAKDAQNTDLANKKAKDEQDAITKTKASAKKVIADKAAEATKAVKQLQNLSAENSRKYLTFINEALTNYDTQIEQSTTISIINNTTKDATNLFDSTIGSAKETNLIDKTNQEQQERIAHDIAIEKQKLTQTAKEAKDRINGYMHLSNDERKKALSDIDAISEDANKKADKAVRVSDAEIYRKEAETSIEKEVAEAETANLAKAKTAGKLQLKDKAATAQAELDQLKSLSNENLKKAKSKIDEIVAGNNVEIDKANDTSLIKSLCTNAALLIDKVVTEHKDEESAKAKESIAEKKKIRDEKRKKIDKNNVFELRPTQTRTPHPENVFDPKQSIEWNIKRQEDYLKQPGKNDDIICKHLLFALNTAKRIYPNAVDSAQGADLLNTALSSFKKRHCGWYAYGEPNANEYPNGYIKGGLIDKAFTVFVSCIIENERTLTSNSNNTTQKLSFKDIKKTRFGQQLEAQRKKTEKQKNITPTKRKKE